MNAGKGKLAPHRLANKIDRPHEIRVMFSHAERLLLGKLSERTGKNCSTLIREAVKKMAESET